MQPNMDHVFVFIDVSDSVGLKHMHVEEQANEIIAERLKGLEKVLFRADENVRREGDAAGDSIFLVGHDVNAIFKACVIAQASWRAWQEGPPVRIAIGYGVYTPMDDGHSVVLRSKVIDLTRRILDVTPKAGVCVTESVRVELQYAGLQNKLHPRAEVLKGFGDEPQAFYEANHLYRPPPDERQLASDSYHAKTVLERRQNSQPMHVELKGAIPIEVKEPHIIIDHFWRIFAVACLIVTLMIAGVAFFHFNGKDKEPYEFKPLPTPEQEKRKKATYRNMSCDNLLTDCNNTST